MVPNNIKEAKDVAVGQLYRDNDPRETGRVVRVTKLFNDFFAHVENVDTHRKSRIRRKRLVTSGSRGYTYLGMDK